MNGSSDWFPGTTLNRRFALYLPTVQKSGEPTVAFEILADATADLLCELFGGVTAYPSEGRFKRSSGKFQKEAILVLECFCERKLWEENSALLRDVTGLLSRLLNQESVACSLDGEMSFVVPAKGTGGSPPTTTAELRRAASEVRRGAP